MEDHAEKSCWGITAWAVVVFGVGLLIAATFGGVDTGAVVAASITN